MSDNNDIDEVQPLLNHNIITNINSPPLSPSSNNNNNKRISLLHLMGIIFFLVSGGPAGIEDVVKASGPLPALIAILIVPIIWALPQALMTAELSTMNDHNGGYVIWITRAFGPFAGWLNAYNAFFSNTLDLSLYPILFVDFIERMITITTLHRWILYFLAINIVTILNIRSLRVVGSAAVIMTMLVCLPYIIETIYVFMYRGGIDFNKVKQSLPAKDINYALFLNTVLWNFTGWDSVGTIAGEIDTPGKTYPIGVTLGCLFITILYFVSVIVGVSLSKPDWSLWNEGYLIYLASTISPFIGDFSLVTSAISALGSFNANMSANARAIWCMADYGWAPNFLKYVSNTGAPVNAVLTQSFVVFILCFFSFESVVAVSNLTNCISLFSEFSAFIQLKLNEPNASRPYAVPGGIWGAIIITIPKVILLFIVMVVTPSGVWIIVIIINIIIVIAYFYVQPTVPKINVS